MTDTEHKADSAETPYDIAGAAERHADLILRASGSALRNYEMPSNRKAILSAVIDCMEESYKAGAGRALAMVRAAHS